MNSLKGKTALLTGASRGIGLAIAESLSREGVRLALVSRRPPPDSALGLHLPCDLADAAAIPAVIIRALEYLGPCDFLINNAGLFHEKLLVETELADWDRVLRVNVTAPFLVCRQVLPGMVARRSGRILNVSSTAGVQPYPHQSAYCASKHALLGLTRCLALEARPHGVHVHAVCPGGVETDLLKGTQLGVRMSNEPKIAAADIAAMVLFLLRQPGNVDIPELVVRRFVPK